MLQYIICKKYISFHKRQWQKMHDIFKRKTYVTFAIYGLDNTQLFNYDDNTMNADDLNNKINMVQCLQDEICII